MKIMMAAIAIILLMLVAFSSARSGFWPLLHDFSLRVVVGVTRAELRTPSALLLDVDSACNGNPEVAYLRETDVDVEVMVSADSHPFSGGVNDCGATVEVQLQEPLGDRVLMDKHSGSPVRVERISASGNLESGDQGNLLDDAPQQINDSPNEGDQGNLPDVAPQQINDPPNEAELQDLQRIADQKGISLDKSINDYGWQNNFSMLVQEISADFPSIFARAEIGDGGSAWIEFTDPAPQVVLDLIDDFNSNHPSVTVEARSGSKFTGIQIQNAVPAAHYAVQRSPEVREATTSFDHETSQLTSTVILEPDISDSILDVLKARAANAVTETVGANFLSNIEIVIIRSNQAFLLTLE